MSTLQPEDLQTRGLQQQPLILGRTPKSIDDHDDGDGDDHHDDDDHDNDLHIFWPECKGRSQREPLDTTSARIKVSGQCLVSNNLKIPKSMATEPGSNVSVSNYQSIIVRF